MEREPRIADAIVPAPTIADGTPAAFARSRLSGFAAEPELDRWTGKLLACADVAVAAFSVLEAGHVRVRSLSTREDLRGDSVREALSEQLEEALIARAESAASSEPQPACLVAPVTASGDLVGWLSITDHVGRAWNDQERQILQLAAAATGADVELGLARDAAARAQELVVSHNRVHDLIARAAPLPDVLAEIAASIERHDPSVIASVLLLDRESSTLHPGAGPSLPPDYMAAIDGVVIGPNVGSCGSAAWSGQLTISEDLAQDPKWAPIRELAQSAGLGHCWSMPITASGGEVLGTLAFYGPAPRSPQAEHLTLLQDWARVAGIAIERHKSLEQLLLDARHDGLTGLANRTAIFETLDRALARADERAPVAVMFVDLDGLKAVNDTLGHDHADEMIAEIGNRLAAAVRASDVVGRFGGDEFVVIAEDIADPERAGQLALRLLDAISRPLPGLNSAVVTASIGIAVIRSPLTDVREAIRQADSAMYDAKRSGRDRCAFFEGRQRVRPGRHLVLARELRGAELRGELSLAFQPVLELATGRIVGVEALLRWSSPTLGAVTPQEFIPIAEDTGAIVPIGAWVLRESCETLARITGELGRPLELAVNVSTHQLAKPGFALSVQRTVAHAEFPIDMLALEITETALMRPNAVTDRTLQQLDALGVQIVLDDFGTGFSSLSWLKQHPLGAIKIDRGFITGLADDRRDQAIVAAVIGMGQALGYTVTAEGVETEEQLAALRGLSCDRMQGFLVARPLTADSLAALLSSGGNSASPTRHRRPGTTQGRARSRRADGRTRPAPRATRKQAH
jgi:diguanylate cyclase (GGDEF)-like protein